MRRRTSTGRLRRKSWPLLAAGVAAAGIALARISAQGFGPSGRLPLPVLAVYTAGVLLLITAGAMRTRPDRRTQISR
ncbi:hypothetical protein AB0L00_23505 [Actinoallomurus sp. NPDC052308]|uniref:hypothetical protein n=1 Tax=Actinoallomurus sp. NPDC052308 TaxID=3155530 RepID=UPI00341D5976